MPPHILHEIARRGTAKQRDIALDTLGSDHSLRSARAAFQLMATGAHKFLAAGLAPTTPQITIYDAGSDTTLPGRVTPGEPRQNTDDEVREAFLGQLATFNFYLEVFKRNSIDDHGLPLLGSVHYGEKYDNAFWNGQQMVYGDGDGELFQRFTISIDIIGHEMTHGVTGDTLNLAYQGQSGALNESISDVFGSMVKQYSANPKQTVDQADWLIGQGILMPSVKGKALRSMSDPGTAYDDPALGKDPQPNSMQNYNDSDQDNGGVHINSGIPNRAFYLAAKGFGGYSWEKAGRVWYETLRDPSVTPTANFSDFARSTIASANKLFGVEGRQILTDAWRTVGVDVS
jgi:Zn-dependent metalloprotease